MTIKQLIIGGVIGASALGAMIHRIPKPDTQAIKLASKSSIKNAKLAKATRKRASAERLTITKVFG
jgi:hypothetical protein